MLSREDFYMIKQMSQQSAYIVDIATQIGCSERMSTADEKWFFRNLGEDFHASGLITLRLSSSKSGSTIHLVYQHLQAIYMTFDNTITPATADCLIYSRSIGFHLRSYAPKFC